MSLYSDWKEIAEQERGQAENDKFWNDYFDLEAENYIKILSNHEHVFSGKLAELADEFGMDDVTFTGFLDGINTSLKERLELEHIKPSSQIALDVDFEKLFYNMHAARAGWLYELDEWDDVLTAARRKEIAKEYRASLMYTKPDNVGRNDACPCGSGKKYKKCCGA